MSFGYRTCHFSPKGLRSEGQILKCHRNKSALLFPGASPFGLRGSWLGSFPDFGLRFARWPAAPRRCWAPSSRWRPSATSTRPGAPESRSPGAGLAGRAGRAGFRGAASNIRGYGCLGARLPSKQNPPVFFLILVEVIVLGSWT